MRPYLLSYLMFMYSKTIIFAILITVRLSNSGGGLANTLYGYQTVEEGWQTHCTVILRYHRFLLVVLLPEKLNHQLFRLIVGNLTNQSSG